MHFDLVDLRLFVAVAEARSITGGAAAAHLALASASARIQGLEAAVGVALLKRGRRGVTLTAAGESLLGHARLVLHDVETLRSEMTAYASGSKASIAMLANTVGLSEHLPKALAAFLREHPQVSLDVEERESADIAQAIAGGTADLGFAAEHTLPDSLDRFIFSEDRLVLVTAPRSDLAHHRHVDFNEVADRDFIGLTNATALQNHIGKYAARMGKRLRFRAQMRDFDAMCQMAAAQVGIAVVPEVAARRCARSMAISLVKIRDPWANRKLAICFRDLATISRPAQQLIAHLRAAAR
ncbi:LysR family transcriptional regulator [Tardiphaga alba]|uniref:LysR family transcriptional regulator n=1 Tax=Tardiphaga alba TaxID=340268 RepID=A0ABX8ADW5_9BRAD|nr:LysR substrate-binding domain-containing protein [Tardiphaga alba]QUS41702.1 LysR family transcriptional regulator [Tardiphaga alba]